MTTKTPLTINVSPDFRDALKIQAVAHGKTLQDYVTDTLMDCLQHDCAEEDRVWGEMSEAAKKEGLMSSQDSESLLARLKNA